VPTNFYGKSSFGGFNQVTNTSNASQKALYDVVLNPSSGRLVSVGYGYGGALFSLGGTTAYSNDNGVNWTVNIWSTNAFPSANNPYVMRAYVAFNPNNERYVLATVGNPATVFTGYSDDGINWSSPVQILGGGTVPQGAFDINCVFYSPTFNKWFIPASNTSGTPTGYYGYSTSSDGANWTNITTVPSWVTNTFFVYGMIETAAGSILAYGRNAGISISTDGTTWSTPVNLFGTAVTLYSMVKLSNGNLVAVGMQTTSGVTRIFTTISTNNGLTWSAKNYNSFVSSSSGVNQDILPSGSPRSLSYNSTTGQIVLLTYKSSGSPNYLYSPHYSISINGGTTFSATVPIPSAQQNCLLYGISTTSSNKFAAVGFGSVLYSEAPNSMSTYSL
jgi:hypothetical protein